MRFGPVPVAEAVGHVLAHSVQLPAGRLRKGMILSKGDVAALAASGFDQITVARLDPGDIGENDAAEALARALVPDPKTAGLHLSAPFTGRVNLLADGPGLARIDAAAIDRVNHVHPMITVSTVPRWQRMDRDGMVATVKIISYAVPGTALERACELAPGALTLQRPMLSRAEFIETRISGRAEGPTSDKGYRMMQGRLDRLGVDLSDPVAVAHRIAPLVQAIAACDAELILILTGSATSDPTDVAPEAVRRAGGEIIHFGMPVDPGNLLFLGRIGAQMVIGLPGSARSPAVSGVDWVLERVICGLQVSPQDIMDMGVGGLLKEIPTRPQPRGSRN
ncbi:molybdopterin-binding protein [Sedimentitalea todarodis]|uniref:Molybdopterin-binding protein n=1 Tax=Sedimentitalea todarodis TaxID=1631240 RepID=A0ABU3VBC1_9RHOB|nr:molybdopterin-binding protein [Sedimentitalea todarodis]MDU9003470.1 molybdopterin-binding protein [Sedimentitalea todarodis]